MKRFEQVPELLVYSISYEGPNSVGPYFFNFVGYSNEKIKI